VIDGFTLTFGYAYGGSLTYGGGLYSNYGKINILNCSLLRNYASYGAGIYARYGNMLIKNSTLTRNKAAQGGGLYSNYCALLIDSTAMTSNYAGSSGNGNALYINAGTLTLKIQHNVE